MCPSGNDAGDVDDAGDDNNDDDGYDIDAGDAAGNSVILATRPSRTKMLASTVREHETCTNARKKEYDNGNE